MGDRALLEAIITESQATKSLKGPKMTVSLAITKKNLYIWDSIVEISVNWDSVSWYLVTMPSVKRKKKKF